MHRIQKHINDAKKELEDWIKGAGLFKKCPYCKPENRIACDKCNSDGLVTWSIKEVCDSLWETSKTMAKHCAEKKTKEFFAPLCDDTKEFYYVIKDNGVKKAARIFYEELKEQSLLAFKEVKELLNPEKIKQRIKDLYEKAFDEIDVEWETFKHDTRNNISKVKECWRAFKHKHFPKKNNLDHSKLAVRRQGEKYCKRFCSKCNGDKHSKILMLKCEACNGTGKPEEMVKKVKKVKKVDPVGPVEKVKVPKRDPDAGKFAKLNGLLRKALNTCPNCKGRRQIGVLFDKTCPICNGVGTVTGSKAVVPKGILANGRSKELEKDLFGRRRLSELHRRMLEQTAYMQRERQ